MRHSGQMLTATQHRQTIGTNRFICDHPGSTRNDLKKRLDTSLYVECHKFYDFLRISGMYSTPDTLPALLEGRK